MGKQDLARAKKHARERIPFAKDWELIKAEGAGWFISRLTHRRPDGSLHTWTSRIHRKGSGLRLELKLLFELGGWISILFMIGAACFAVGGLACLAPDLLGAAFEQPTVVNSVFFIGSLFFTSAAYLQLLEAANADRRAAQARERCRRSRSAGLVGNPGRLVG